jgi:hypothetical protein
MTIHFVPVVRHDSHLPTKLTPATHAEARPIKRGFETLARRLQDEVVGLGLGIIWIVLGMRKFCMDRRRD